MNLVTFLVVFQEKNVQRCVVKEEEQGGIRFETLDLTEARTGRARRNRWSAPATEACTPDQQEQLWMNIKTIMLAVLR